LHESSHARFTLGAAISATGHRVAMDHLSSPSREGVGG
jgi:hypothetical protein